MDAVQMQYEFDNECRNHDKLRGLDISTDDIEMYLNRYQEITLNKYFELINKEGYAKTIITPLFRSKRYLLNEGFTDDSSLLRGVYFELPADFKYVIEDGEEANVSDGTTTYRIRVKPVTETHSNLNKENPFKVPYKAMAWRLNYGVDNTVATATTHQVIVGYGLTLVHYFLSYIKEPIAINIATNNTCELNSSCHREIVIGAVNLFIKSVENNLSLQKKTNN